MFANDNTVCVFCGIDSGDEKGYCCCFLLYYAMYLSAYANHT